MAKIKTISILGGEIKFRCECDIKKNETGIAGGSRVPKTFGNDRSPNFSGK